MPNRSPQLRWEADEETAPAGLGRAAVVAAAIAVADAEGFAAVSIRRVAAELGVRPMSLYTHIAAKDDLVDLMINEAVAGIVVPEPLPTGWRAALTAISQATFDTFAAHPWVLKALGTTGRRTPNANRHAEQTAAAVAELNLDEPALDMLVGIVDDYVLGHLVRVRMLGLMPDSIARPDGAFAIGLEAVLDGVEQRFLR